MGWALYEKNDCQAALTSMRKMSRMPSGAYRMLAGIYACLGNQQEAKGALAVFLQNSPGVSISKQRRKWEKIWIAPGSLDRWIEHMRIAGFAGGQAAELCPISCRRSSPDVSRAEGWLDRHCVTTRASDAGTSGRSCRSGSISCPSTLAIT